MSDPIQYTTRPDIDVDELLAFYERQHAAATTTNPQKLRRMVDQAYCFVTARLNGELIGVARGITDGMRGYLAECKLDPRVQGPACVTKTDGRVEHDSHGIAREMASRIVDALVEDGVDHIQVLAYGTEEDFCVELGFKRISGMVPLQLTVGERLSAAADTVVESR